MLCDGIALKGSEIFGERMSEEHFLGIDVRTTFAYVQTWLQVKNTIFLIMSGHVAIMSGHAQRDLNHFSIMFLGL